MIIKSIDSQLVWDSIAPFSEQISLLFYILSPDQYPAEEIGSVMDFLVNQLLAIGFDRRELHVGLQAFDAGLEVTRHNVELCIAD